MTSKPRWFGVEDSLPFVSSAHLNSPMRPIRCLNSVALQSNKFNSTLSKVKYSSYKVSICFLSNCAIGLSESTDD